MADENKTEKDLVVLEQIENKIYSIRGQRIMLDADLAEVYEVETRTLNQVVKRNLHRFPEDFMFQLAEDKVEELRNSSQVVMSSRKHRGVSYRPYAFTEHGAVMLASVLKSLKSIEASIQVVRAFVRLRTILTEHQELARRIEELEEKFITHDENFKGVFITLRQIRL